MKTPRSSGIGPVGLAFLSAALFGAATPASKILLDRLPPFQLAGLLYLGAALAVAPVVLGKSELKAPWRLGYKSSLSLVGSMIFGGILAPLFLLFGLKLASGGSVSMWLGLEGVATAILAFFLFREHLGVKAWIGIAGALLSSVVLASGVGSGGLAAGLLVALACLCWGMDNNLSSLIDGVSPAQVTFWKGLVAGSFNLTIGLVLAPFGGSILTGAAGIAVGACAYGLSLVLYLSAAQRLGATRGQMIFASAPFVGVALSAIFLAEGVSTTQWIALGIFAASLCILFRDHHEHAHDHEEMQHIHTHSHDEHHDHEHDGEQPTAPHSHWHEHHPMSHRHRHYPDLHHRHAHKA